MTDERELTEIQIEAIEKETRGFECPECHAHLQFRLAVKVLGVVPTLTGEQCAERDGRPILTKVSQGMPAIEKPSLLRLIEHYRDSGLLAAFESVVVDIKAHQLPTDMGKFLLSWLRVAVQATMIPKLALQRLINEFDGRIEVWTAQEIGAVVSDGRIRCFMPMHLLRGEIVRLGGGSNTKLRTRATEERLEIWIKTKHGYVASKGMMFQELQKKAKGCFDNIRSA